MTRIPFQDANAGLAGRKAECARLDRLLADARVGQSAVLVLRGEAGIGKTALMGYAAERAAGCRVVRAVGVESEMELPFAGSSVVRARCWSASDSCRHRNAMRSGRRLA